ncbi:hypothetical protein GGR56DRAFT_278796 [Xylariaceae sp. FL0804]|nr:hypothetical protein GGR56DRAFT_278796 [Xylariaceae sp. FL0804]
MMNPSFRRWGNNLHRIGSYSGQENWAWKHIPRIRGITPLTMDDDVCTSVAVVRQAVLQHILHCMPVGAQSPPSGSSSLAACQRRLQGRQGGLRRTAKRGCIDAHLYSNAPGKETARRHGERRGPGTKASPNCENETLSFGKVTTHGHSSTPYHPESRERRAPHAAVVAEGIGCSAEASGELASCPLVRYQGPTATHMLSSPGPGRRAVAGDDQVCRNGGRHGGGLVGASNYPAAELLLWHGELWLEKSHHRTSLLSSVVTVRRGRIGKVHT